MYNIFIMNIKNFILKIKNNKFNRYISIIAMLVFILPTFFITIYAGKIGIYIGSTMYMIIGMLGIWEVLVSMGFNKYVSAIPAITIIPFFLLNFVEFQHISSITAAHVNVKNLLTWEPYLILIISSFIPILVEPHVLKGKINLIIGQLIILFVIIISATFSKGMWAMNISGIKWVLFFIPIAIISDSFSYFGGKIFGKKWFKGKKLAPKISPNKTWAGAVIGFVFSFIFTFIVGYYMGIWHSLESINQWVISFIMAIIFSIASPLGDLIFSLIKRKIGVKDFSNLFPGHGGIFDRIDAISVVSCLGVLIFLLTTIN